MSPSSASPSPSSSSPQPQDPSTITGNASLEIKTHLCDLLALPIRQPEYQKKIFATTCMTGMRLTEVGTRPMVDEPEREEARVVMELVVREEMMNFANTVHGGCIAYLVDFCSSLALVVLRTKQKGELASISVSQSMNVVFHSPALLGDTLRIVNSTITSGSRVMTARTEIWDDTHHRLVATGVHVKMEPSPPKAKM
ncbi:Thioesterase/thiol ester dehydrase-isomerase [Dendrothele bispora CBS 962.96]|uniref:Thioesterase/thiol ester dehydrase-isomerase n=1 Tax=Dendrothele bispora (strain CBS 962.96) TaxID=1314807 RepID=A0A4S8MKP6_DENBC|nr:Thioesterase/thiol ester dehydrase-isomerase [Dendrothele bispora CBS 962.96]